MAERGVYLREGSRQHGGRDAYLFWMISIVSLAKALGCVCVCVCVLLDWGPPDVAEKPAGLFYRSVSELHQPSL